MRAVRNLSGLAGPSASLKDAGKGGGVDVGPSVVDHKFAGGESANVPAYSASVTIEGVKSGDLLVAVTYAGGAFGEDETASNGRTEVTDPGWSEVAVILGELRVFTKIADGSETTVSGTGMRSGGLTVWVLRGVAEPTAADIASWEFYENFDNNVYSVDHTPMADQTFDVVLMQVHKGNSKITLSTYGGDTWYAKSTVLSDATDGVQSFTFFAPSGLGRFSITQIGSTTDLHTNNHFRLGLRFA